MMYAITLPNEAFEELLAMLAEDREPSPALLRAGKRYRDLVGWTFAPKLGDG